MRRAEIIWTVVVGGGSGHRYGTAKQYEMLGDRRVIDHSAAVAREVSAGVVVVVPAADAESERAVAGGATRSDSVRAGLAHVPAEATIICVHDAARPLATVDIYGRVVDAVVAGADAAVPGIVVTDTIKIIAPASPPDFLRDFGERSRRVVETPDRSTLVAVQTPQAFRAAALRAAHAGDGDATDDAALIERSGGIVVVVDGSVTNRKITVPDDLMWARAQVALR